jgi:hypothetical protein
LVDQIMGRWINDPSKADMIGEHAGNSDQSPG